MLKLSFQDVSSLTPAIFFASVQRPFTTVVPGYATCTLESLPAHKPADARSKKSVPCQDMKLNCKASLY